MLIRQTILYLPAQILGPAVQFLAILVWAQLLKPADVGVITLSIAIQELCFAGFFMWWSHYALRYIKSFPTGEGRAPFVEAEGVAILGSSVLQCIFLIPFLTFYFGAALSANSIAVLIGFMLTRSFTSYVAERSRAEAEILLYSIVQLSVSVFGFLVGLLFLYVGERSADSVLLGFLIAQLIVGVLSVLYSDIGRSWSLNVAGVLKKSFSFGAPVMVGSIFSLLSLNAPRFIVDNLLGIHVAGTFAIGYGLGLRASSFAVMLVTAGAYPLVVRKMEEEGVAAAYEQLRSNIVLVVMVVVPVAAGVLALSSSLVSLLVAEAYRDVTSIVLPLSTLAGLFRYIRSHTTDQVFLLNSKPSVITFFGGLDVIVSLVGSLFGAKVYGVVGAVVGPLIASVLIFFLSAFFATRVFGFRLPYRSVMQVFFSALVMALIVRYLSIASSYVELALRVFVGALVYIAMIFVLMPAIRDSVLARRRA